MTIVVRIVKHGETTAVVATSPDSIVPLVVGGVPGTTPGIVHEGIVQAIENVLTALGGERAEMPLDMPLLPE